MKRKDHFISCAMSLGAAVLLTIVLSLFGIGIKSALANANQQQTTTPMTHTMPITQTAPITPTMSTQSGMMQPGMMQEQMMGMMNNMQSMMAHMQRMMQAGVMDKGMMDQGMTKQSDMMMPDHMMQCHMMFMMAHMQAMMGKGMMGEMMGGMSMQDERMMESTIDRDKPEMKAMMGMMADMQAMLEHMQAMMQGGMMGEMMGGGGMAQAAPANPPAAPNAQLEGAMEQTAHLRDIEVKVTATNLKEPHELAFTVDLNASGVDLGFDLAKEATLKVGDLSIPASAWEVAYNHGHHVNGTLKFAHHGKVQLAAGDEVQILIKHPNGKDETTLHWNAPTE